MPFLPFYSIIPEIFFNFVGGKQTYKTSGNTTNTTTGL